MTDTSISEKYQNLKGYLGGDGRFDRLPGKRQKKLQALMFEFLAEQFQYDKKYTESKVNEILERHHSFKDPASLRRFMIGKRLLERTIDGRQYWRTKKLN